jgi:hypothetical protein
LPLGAIAKPVHDRVDSRIDPVGTALGHREEFGGGCRVAGD